MNVRELITELRKFQEDMPVCDACYIEIDGAVEKTWEDTNYPYNRPNKQVVVLY